MIPWAQRGSSGWLFLGAAIVAWDLLAPDQQTLSESFRRAHSHPGKAAVQAVGWALLTAHLYNAIPKPLDPLHAIHVARDARRARRAALAA